MQTIQQERAKFALTRVLQAKQDLESQKQDDDKKDSKNQEQEADNKNRAKKAKDEYKSHASALPAMIHINGLGQAAAFYKSKGKGDKDKPHEMLYQLLSDWLTKKRPNESTQPYTNNQDKDLIQCIVESDMHQYRLAQAEAQALMDWVKKFAKAYMED